MRLECVSHLSAMDKLYSIIRRKRRPLVPVEMPQPTTGSEAQREPEADRTKATQETAAPSVPFSAVYPILPNP
jgi:hypothetical protein